MDTRKYRIKQIKLESCKQVKNKHGENKLNKTAENRNEYIYKHIKL